jgi:hypothetical protein
MLMSVDCIVCCTVDACSFVYSTVRFGSTPEENSCVVSLNARLMESCAKNVRSFECVSTA